MKLYEVPRNSRIKIKGLEVNGVLTEEFNFHHMDGMFSFCTTDEGLIIKPHATTEVEFLRRFADEEFDLEN